MKSKFSSYNKLGVVNMTPNSFSDGGLNLNLKNLKNNLDIFFKYTNLILDIGFESTAPMNQAITLKEEVKRFDEFFSFLKKHPGIKKIKYISIDTYKLSNVAYFYTQIKKINPGIRFILNDVSGVLDLSLANLLRTYPDIIYIYSNTRIPNRESVLEHKNYLASSKSIIDETIDNFKRVEQFWMQHQLTNLLILDPAFCFSKTLEENWTLIDGIPFLLGQFKRPFLMGFSRKSFMHKKIESLDPIADSELIHYYLIDLINTINLSFGRQILFRVHDPQIVP